MASGVETLGSGAMVLVGLLATPCCRRGCAQFMPLFSVIMNKASLFVSGYLTLRALRCIVVFTLELLVLCGSQIKTRLLILATAFYHFLMATVLVHSSELNVTITYLADNWLS